MGDVDASAAEEVGTPDAPLVPSYSFTSSETTTTTTSSTMTEAESMTSSRERRKLRRESKKSITVSSSASPPCDRADIDIDPTSCYTNHFNHSCPLVLSHHLVRRVFHHLGDQYRSHQSGQHPDLVDIAPQERSVAERSWGAVYPWIPYPYPVSFFNESTPCAKK